MEKRRMAVNIGSGNACVPPKPNIILPKYISGNGNSFRGMSREKSAYEIMPICLANDWKFREIEREREGGGKVLLSVLLQMKLVIYTMHGMSSR